jgi:hypothetical protein
MEKERLTISEARITVEYEFLNESPSDITTEVAFPVPEYNVYSFITPGPRDLEGWHVWVEGRELRYQVEARAMLGSRDYTKLLAKLGIDVGSFGHLDFLAAGGEFLPDIQRLSQKQQSELTQAGLMRDDLPQWAVLKTYHWQQTFPAGKILHIRHEYQPQLGLQHMDVEELQGKNENQWVKLSSVCLDSPLRNRLIAAAPNDNGFAEGYVEASWVDYILTTANTWKTPIKEFELVIERPKPKGREHFYVSLCWDGKIDARGADTFVAKAANFVPKRELRVMFFQVGK